MKYALNLAEDGRILSATYHHYAPAGAVIVDALPDGDIYEYRYEHGAYVHDPVTQSAPEPIQQTLENRVDALELDGAEMREALNMILSGVTE